MRRLYFCLRVLVVTVVFPVILIYIAVATVIHPALALRTRFRTTRRLWMSVADWIKGIPVGYSYWEQFEAPSMVDEIAVHHDD